MNRRELVRAAIHHQETPRVPYLIDFCADAQEIIQAAIGEQSVDEFVDNDVYSVNAPWWNWHELAPDWRGPAAPTSRATVMGTRSYPEFIDEVKRAADTTDKYILLRVYGSHFEKAYFARGIENFLADMAGEPDFAREFLKLIIDKNMVMLENILSLKEIDGVLLGSDWGSQIGLLMRPSTWEEMIRPGEQREYDLVHDYGKDVWVHSCGNVEKIIPSLVEMGLDVLNPLQPEAMDIYRIKELYGDKLAFWGGLSTQQTLPFGTADELRAEAKRVRDGLSVGGGYVFSPAQSIQSDVPLENMLALIEFAKQARQD